MRKKYEFAKKIVQAAGDFLREQSASDCQVETKTSPTDLVTQLDKQVQATLIQQIKVQYPQDNFLAEEGNMHHPYDQGNVWIIDPIDGTNNFVGQGRDYAVMLAYLENGQGKFAVIYDVARSEMLHGGGDFEVEINDSPLGTPIPQDLSRSLVAMNSGMYADNEAGLADLARQSLGLRIYGSAAISFSRVLQGGLLFYVSYLHPWDYAAAGVLGQKLGFKLLTLEGRKPTYQGSEKVMLIHESRLSLMDTVFNQEVQP